MVSVSVIFILEVSYQIFGGHSHKKKQEIIRTCWSLSLHKTIVKYGKKTNDAVT